MKEKIKGSKPLQIILAAALVLLVLVAGMVCKSTWFQRDYIGGNVLNLPYPNTWNDDNLIDSPWKNAQFYTGLMYRNLFLADSTFENVEPDLAQTYAVLDDGLTYEITLKSDLFWSDGEMLTVDDVVFSIEAVMQAENVNGIYTAAFANITGMADFLAGTTDSIAGLETSDDTIYITLDTQYPTMLQVLAQFVILPAHCFLDADLAQINSTEYWADPVVSGMYCVGEVVPYDTVTLVKNSYYSEQEPNIDEVILYVNYKYAALDYYSTNNITEMINYRSMRDMTEYKVDVLFYRYLVFNVEGTDSYDSSAMQDPLVRQAIAYAIDRDSLIYDVYLDSGTLIDSGVPHSDDAYDGYTTNYDPELAKELLAEADYDFSRPLVLSYYYTDSTSAAFMEELKEDLEYVGFTVELFLCETGSDLYDNRNYDIFLKGLSAFDVSEWYIEYTSLSPQMAKIFGDTSSFEETVSSLTHEVDTDARNELLAELQALEHEEMMKIPLFTLSQVLYLNEERLNIPSGITFGNTWYKYDVDFENWSIKRE